MKYSVIFIMLFFYGCGITSKQFTFYENTEIEKPWKVSIIQEFNKNSFKCYIDDQEVLDESFGLFDHSFETSGLYQGKKVIMSGYKKEIESSSRHGSTVSYNRYTIRVFIDSKEVGKFMF